MAAAPKPGIVEKDSIGLPGSSSDFDCKILEQITRSAQYATGASGAALVLSDRKLMSCRASSGELGPPVGTRLNTDTGFTATCVQTEEVVRCDDTETDPRVDGSSCVELGIRSILAVPLFNARNVAGVLEVLSHEPNRFTEKHTSALQLLARLVETLLNYASRGDVALETIAAEVKPPSDHPGQVSTDQAKCTCLSCRHPNPQGSQFCNQCGVLLFSFLGPQDMAADLILPAATESNDQGFKDICTIISGNAGTWNEISEKLLADRPNVAAEQKPGTVATEEAAQKTVEVVKTEDIVQGPGKAQEAAGLKARLGAVRRSLWL
jgi:GAF domain